MGDPELFRGGRVRVPLGRAQPEDLLVQGREGAELGHDTFGERAPEARASYEQGWPVVLGAYAALVAG